MNVLIVHYQISASDRNTISEHLYSFKKYSNHKVTYLNAFSGIPPLIEKLNFDVILYHYTFLSQKWNGPRKFKKFISKCVRLKKIKALAVAMPQDEYVLSDLLCEFFREFKVKVLFTCLEESEWQKVYPQEKTGIEHYHTTLTGYVDEQALQKVVQFTRPQAERKFDLGYRARKLPYWLGEHGTIKWRLTEAFQLATKGTGLSTSLSNNESEVFYGDNWYKFLADCRVVLGCEGGASLHDPDGQIRQAVNLYCEQNPKATFSEVKEKLFKDRDHSLRLFAISPRHFEACMTKTTQALVEGDYFGIFKANVHYIPIRKDFSNIAEVIERIKDHKLCEQLAENAYRDIILSGEYTYRKFVSGFFASVTATLESSPREVKSGNWLAALLLVSTPPIGHVVALVAYRLRYVGFRLITRLGLLPLWRRVQA